jgi:hypothetical protein
MLTTPSKRYPYILHTNFLRQSPFLNLQGSTSTNNPNDVYFNEVDKSFSRKSLLSYFNTITINTFLGRFYLDRLRFYSSKPQYSRLPKNLQKIENVNNRFHTTTNLTKFLTFLTLLKKKLPKKAYVTFLSRKIIKYNRIVSAQTLFIKYPFFKKKKFISESFLAKRLNGSLGNEHVQPKLASGVQSTLVFSRPFTHQPFFLKNMPLSLHPPFTLFWQNLASLKSSRYWIFFENIIRDLTFLGSHFSPYLTSILWPTNHFSSNTS